MFFSFGINFFVFFECFHNLFKRLGSPGEFFKICLNKYFVYFLLMFFKELSSNRIQETMLDQTRVVCRGQKILVWINKSMYITLKIGKKVPKTEKN